MTRREQDRRRRPRTPIEKLAQIELHGSNEELLGIVTDVSTNGLSINTERAPRIGEQVTIRAALGHDKRSVPGEIVRVEKLGDGHYVVGVAYDLLALEDDPFLEEALRKSLPR